MNTIEELKKERVQKLNRSGNNVQKVDILLRAVVSAYEIGRSDGAASEQQRIIGMIDAAISDANKNELIADAVKDSELSIHYSRLGCKLKHLNQQILSTPAQEKEYCEWTLDGAYYKTSCGNSISEDDVFPSKNIYCRLCGKPIKIKEA